VKNRDVAAELLKVGLKLTKERMDAITSYVLPCVLGPASMILIVLL
jgi:hypothetical protein